jgi:hypothetical protein
MNRSVLLLTIALFARPWAATPALAEPPPPETLDLTFRSPRDPDTWIRPSLRTDAAWFAGVNTWGGNAEEIIGDRTNGFAQLGLDFAGSNFYDGETRSPSAMTLEDFYVRWNSGALVPTLGKDAIELSVGAQPYQVGPGDLGQGFLFWEGGKSGGRRDGLNVINARLDLKPCRCLPGLRFIGEISGEWVTGNRNLHASIFRLGAHPTASLRTQFFWI